MLQMLLHQRADYLLLSEEEALALRQALERPSSEFRLTCFAEESGGYPSFWCIGKYPII